MIQMHTFDDQTAQAVALSAALGAALQAVLDARPAPGRATLAVSGGNSPKQLLRTLSTIELDWSRIDVTLVDDRWVGPADADSNAGLVRDTLLQNAAGAARFVPLVDVDADPAAHIAALNASASLAAPDVAVLGMGEDGHTASIFADSPQWQEALTTDQPLMLVQPGAAPHLRVSWTMPALKRIGSLFLLIAGDAKLRVLKEAAALPRRQAISQLATDQGVVLEVYWSAS